MTPLKFALFVLYLLAGKTGSSSQDLSSTLRFQSVSVGEDVTLECFYQESIAITFYWYKQTLGQKPELLSKFYKHDEKGTLFGEFRNESRFELDTIPGKNHLKIRKVQDSDSATYYCLSGYSYTFKFIGGVIILVRSPALSVPELVHQAGSETSHRGGSVTLNCSVHSGSCDKDNGVYWFKHSEKSQPGLIYAQGDTSDQCERKSSQRTCIYNLLMENLDVSDAGTYHCAVVSCGHILFGNGTKLDVREPKDVLVYLLSAALTVTTMLSVFLAYKASVLYKTTSCTHSEPDHQARAASASGGEQEADSLHYAALKSNRIKKPARRRDETLSECVYSSVRQ